MGELPSCQIPRSFSKCDHVKKNEKLRKWQLFDINQLKKIIRMVPSNAFAWMVVAGYRKQTAITVISREMLSVNETRNASSSEMSRELTLLMAGATKNVGLPPKRRYEDCI